MAIGHALGRVVSVMAAVALAPAAVALVLREWNAFSALILAAAVYAVFGALLTARFTTRDPMNWSRAIVAVASASLLVPILAALPLYLSGHYATFLDASFDAMSGLTTTGLQVVQDLDHLPRSVNLWRHLLHLAGGQATIVVVLTIFAAGSGLSGSLQGAEIGQERLLPNVSQTVRFVLRLLAVWAAVIIPSLFAAGLVAGLPVTSAVGHAVLLFLSGYSTGGFTPYSSSISYYHSGTLEAVLVVLMVAGAMSTVIHYRLWQRGRDELLRNVESRMFALSITGLMLVTVVGLGRSGAVTDALGMLRRGVFALVAAHTTTGFMNSAPELLARDWGQLAPAAIVGAMAVGGMAASTSGGIGTLRVALVLKGLTKDIRRVLLPQAALIVSTYHVGRQRILDDRRVRSAATVLLLYLFTLTLGAVIILYATTTSSLTAALFESASATTNAGLTTETLTPTISSSVKMTMFAQMWLGRLEFMAAFGLVSTVIALFRGRR